MLQFHDRIFAQHRIVDAARSDRAQPVPVELQWLETPGCVVQRSDVVLGQGLQTDSVVRPGLFLTVLLKGQGQGGPRHGLPPVRFTDNIVVAMALRVPTACAGQAPPGTHLQGAGLAFPCESIARLGLGDAFAALFTTSDMSAVVATLTAPPRLLALAADMLAPGLDGAEEQLLLSAHATEMLVRVIAAMRQRSRFQLSADPRQLRLLAVRDMVDADLRRSWTIAELAHHAGVSRRSFNLLFHRAFGVSAAAYLRTRRLETARTAIVQHGVSVADAAYLAGYDNPANFATAFRRHFGHVPSRSRAML